MPEFCPAIDVATLISVASLMISIAAVWYSRGMFSTDEKRTSADFMLRFTEMLEAGRNDELLDAIENGDKLLKENDGVFSDHDFGKLLDAFELLATVYYHHLINNAMLYEAFSVDVESTFRNEEVVAYLAEVRKDDPDFYEGFERLARDFIRQDERKKAKLKKH